MILHRIEEHGGRSAGPLAVLPGDQRRRPVRRARQRRRTVSYLGVLNGALCGLADWAECGGEPTPDTRYHCIVCGFFTALTDPAGVAAIGPTQSRASRAPGHTGCRSLAG